MLMISTGVMTMAPTSEERREVAERVRKAHGIMAFVDALGIDVDSDWCWTDVSRRVAGLIDPTCYVVGTTSEEGLYGPTIFHHELSCGHTNDTGWPEPPAYCYECGARVVR